MCMQFGHSKIVVLSTVMTFYNIFWHFKINNQLKEPNTASETSAVPLAPTLILHDWCSSKKSTWRSDDVKMSKINLNKLSRKPFMCAGCMFKTCLNFDKVKIHSCTVRILSDVPSNKLSRKHFCPSLMTKGIWRRSGRYITSR